MKKNIGQALPDNKTKCHSKLDLESHRMLLRNDKTLKQVQGLSYRNTTGFTLIEILVVILIIGILAAIALPQYQKAVFKARFANVLLTAQNLRKAEELYFLNHGEYTNHFENLDIDYSGTCSGTGSSIFCYKNFYIDLLGPGYEDDPGKRYVDIVYSPQLGDNLTNAQIIETFFNDNIKNGFQYLIYLDHSSYPRRVTCTNRDSETKDYCSIIN